MLSANRIITSYKTECERVDGAISSIIVFGVFHNFIMFLLLPVVCALTLLFVFSHIFSDFILISTTTEFQRQIRQAAIAVAITIAAIICYVENSQNFYILRLHTNERAYHLTILLVVFFVFIIAACTVRYVFRFNNRHFNVYVHKRSTSNDCTNIVYGAMNVQFTYIYSHLLVFARLFLLMYIL